MKYRLMFTFVVFALLAISAYGQSVVDFEKKYGSQLKAYEIRPGVLMTVKFTESGQASEMRIEHLVASDTSVSIEQEIPAYLIPEIVDELVPVAKRGRKLKTLEPVSMGGETIISGEDYWNVSITNFGKQSKDGSSYIVAIIIKWKKHARQ